MSRLAPLRAWRPALTTVDLLLLIVMAALLRAHLIAALAGSMVALLFAVQHAAIIVVTLLHRPACATAPAQNTSPILLAWAGTLLPLAMQPISSLPNPAGTALIVLGSLCATCAITTLGRSFGVEPADRGVQTSGAYRVVRHPIYAAYVLIVSGFLLCHPSWWNAAVAVMWFVVQVVRVQREEALLGANAAYQAYCGRVRWRLVPGVW